MLIIRLFLAVVFVLQLGPVVELEQPLRATVNIPPRPTRVVIRAWPQLAHAETPRPRAAVAASQQAFSAYDLEPCRSATYRAPVVVEGVTVGLACGNDAAALAAGDAEVKLNVACWYGKGAPAAACPAIPPGIAEALRTSGRLPERYQ